MKVNFKPVNGKINKGKIAILQKLLSTKCKCLAAVVEKLVAAAVVISVSRAIKVVVTTKTKLSASSSLNFSEVNTVLNLTACGYVGSDPEQREAGSSTVTNFTLAVNRKTKDEETKDLTESGSDLWAHAFADGAP